MDDRVLEDLYRRIFGYQFRLTCGNRAETEELTQETIFRVIRSKHELRDPDRLVFWALRIATRVHVDSWRRRAPAPLKSDPEDSRRPFDPDLDEETSRALSRLAVLPEPFRAAITLRYFEDLSYDDVAQILDVPVGTVKSNVARGLRLIRRFLENRT